MKNADYPRDAIYELSAKLENVDDWEKFMLYHRAPSRVLLAYGNESIRIMDYTRRFSGVHWVVAGTNRKPRKSDLPQLPIILSARIDYVYHTRLHRSIVEMLERRKAKAECNITRAPNRAA